MCARQIWDQVLVSLSRNFRFEPLCRASYASPALDTTNLSTSSGPSEIPGSASFAPFSKGAVLDARPPTKCLHRQGLENPRIPANVELKEVGLRHQGAVIRWEAREKRQARTFERKQHIRCCLAFSACPGLYPCASVFIRGSNAQWRTGKGENLSALDSAT
jgi:hypothetical protein